MPTMDNVRNFNQFYMSVYGIPRECSYNIVRLNSGYKVILAKSRRENYRGIGLQLGFETFATAIKKRDLKNVSNNSIKWFQWDEWISDSYDDRLLPVTMDFNGDEYSNPEWGKEICIEK